MSAFVRLTPNFGATLSPFWVECALQTKSSLRAVPRCSPRGTSGRKSLEVTLTESTTRTGFEIALETHSGFFGFEGKIYLEFPRPEFRRVTRYVGLMFPDSFAQVLGVTDVKMSGYRERLDDVNVMHCWYVRLRSADTELRRDAFALLG